MNRYEPLSERAVEVTVTWRWVLDVGMEDVAWIVRYKRRDLVRERGMRESRAWS